MSNDQHEHGNSSGNEESRDDELQPVNGADERDEPRDAEEELHINGVDEREQADRGRRGSEYQEERLVQFIRQEVQQTTQVYMEATPQLHSPEALAKYKDIDPDFPNRLLAMAEREQQAHIDADLLPIKAEAYAYRFAVTVVSLFPTLLVVLGIFLIIQGFDIAGYVASVVGVIGGGAQIIAHVRPRRQGRSNHSPEAEKPKE